MRHGSWNDDSDTPYVNRARTRGENEWRPGIFVDQAGGVLLSDTVCQEAHNGFVEQVGVFHIGHVTDAGEDMYLAVGYALRKNIHGMAEVRHFIFAHQH